MEFWDVYDVDRKKTGRTWQRGNRLENGDYHLVIHVCIFNKDGQMLIQQRQPFKDGWANMWDITVGGSATVGDTSQQAAMRELEEEIGLKIDLSHTRPHLTVNFDEGFDDIYLVEAEVDLDELTLQESEVQAVKWTDEATILDMIRSGEFIPYHEPMIPLLFAMRGQWGGINHVAAVHVDQ
jgi:isopentenyldiphosphate isomerase